MSADRRTVAYSSKTRRFQSSRSSSTSPTSRACVDVCIGIQSTCSTGGCCDRSQVRIVGVWITELPITPERVLRALEAKSGPTREGKKALFDEELSVNAVSSGGMRFEVPA